MVTQSNAAPVIIKRKKVVAGGGHHGGAWKVAYADFVTAMMAFFMLMWLLNATTENQRKGLADYFAPSIPVSRISGGGDGALGGDTIFSEDVLSKMGTGATSMRPTESDRARGEAIAEGAGLAQLKAVQDALFAMAAKKGLLDEIAKHIATRITNEGLIIEIFDLPDAPLFRRDTDEPMELLEEIASLVSHAIAPVPNLITIEGHVAARPIVFAAKPEWQLSTGRADRMRRLLLRHGTEDERVTKVVGHADRVPVTANPMHVENNRLEVKLLLKID